MSEKIAVFVEGDTELIFVRELLCRWYCYDSTKLGFRCIRLQASDVDDGYPTPYDYGDETAAHFYEIVNVGNDNSVLSKAIKNAPRYKNLGYSKIITLRDMYCDNYHSLTRRTIMPEVNRRFIEGSENTIREKGFENFIFNNFAIMEVEAWFLGMPLFLEGIDERLTSDYLRKALDFDCAADPETCIYHPAKVLGLIFNLVGSNYDKHHTEVHSIMSKLMRDDFEWLAISGKCESFARFVGHLTSA